MASHQQRAPGAPSSDLSEVPAPAQDPANSAER